MNEQIEKEITTLLLDSANKLGVNVDFSSKSYDGDLDAPMDMYGFIEYLCDCAINHSQTKPK